MKNANSTSSSVKEFRSRRLPLLPVMLLLGCLFFIPNIRHNAVVSLVVVIMIIRVGCEMRKRIMLGDELLSYRPAIGKSILVPYKEIASLESTRTLEPFMIRSKTTVDALRIQLKNSSVLCLPLSFRDARISSATLIPLIQDRLRENGGRARADASPDSKPQPEGAR
jgi:hypothetical protein